MFSNDKKIVVWGCGQRGKEFIEKYDNTFNIAYCVDSKVETEDGGLSWI
jgi:hypothetical protein